MWRCDSVCVIRVLEKKIVLLYGCDTSAFSFILSYLVPIVSASYSTIRFYEVGMDINHLPSTIFFPMSLPSTATGYIVSFYSTTRTTTRRSSIFSLPSRTRKQDLMRLVYPRNLLRTPAARCDSILFYRDDIKQCLPAINQMEIRKEGIRIKNTKNTTKNNIIHYTFLSIIWKDTKLYKIE